MGNKVLVLGLTPQGLSVLRVLAREGVEVISFYNNQRNVGRYSKYGEKIFFEDIDDLKDKIMELLRTLNYKPLCYITSGEILASVLRDFPEIYSLCRVISGPYEVIEKLAHKNIMYDIAIAKGLNVARFITLDKYSKGDLNFPLFIKRNYEISLFFKADLIPDEKKMNEYLRKIKPEQKKDIILQEYISIPDSNLNEISVQTFFVKGEPKGFLICNQKERLSKGLTAYLEEIDDLEIRNKMKTLCSSFMRDLHYTGFAEFEFMYDTQKKELFFIEVNTRTCGLQSSLNHKFSNLGQILKSPFDAPPLIERQNHLKWINIQRDLRARFQKKNFSNLSIFYQSSYDILDFDDIRPFIRQFF